MLTLDQWQTIRHLAAIGQSERFIADLLKISRSTVSRAIKQESMEEYHRVSTTLCSLEVYQAVVIAGLKRGLNGRRIYELVVESGYSGSQSSFYRWLKTVVDSERDIHLSSRYETASGEQAQYDWSPYTVRIGSRNEKIFIFSLVLGYSRRMHLYPSMSDTQDSILEGIAAGMEHMGGCCRYLLIDNAKAMVLKHQHHHVDWNKCFLAFCAHYRIQPIASTPHHPQTKGKVENPFRHLERNFLHGNSWRDWDHISDQLLAYEQQREERVHSTTRVTPLARFAQEKAQLIPLPTRRFLGCPNNIRIVNNDGLISYKNNRYCVPVGRGLKQVRVYTRQGRELIICDEMGNEVICHVLYTTAREPVILPECYEACVTRRRMKFSTQKTHLSNRFKDEPMVHAFIECLARLHPNRPENTLGRILELINHIPDKIALMLIAEATTMQRTDVETFTFLLARYSSGEVADTAGSCPVPITSVILPVLDVERSLDGLTTLCCRSGSNDTKEENK